jgi:manganese/zinc/iron transport system permease protein
MIVISVIVATLAAIFGHIGAMLVPQIIGYHSTNTAGMMATMAGLLFGVAALFAPRYGVVVTYVRRGSLSLRILAEDVMGLLYRTEERSRTSALLNRASMRRVLVSKPWVTMMVLALLRRRGDLVHAHGGYGLTDQGRERAKALVRSHRLWEQYFANTVGAVENRIHPNAERLEHYTDTSLRSQLDEEMAHPSLDPHGAPIPSE